MTTRIALVRRPSPRLAEGIVTHIERKPVDVALAFRQWDGYVAALRASDWDVVEVEAAPECPDSAFVEDALVVHGQVAVVANPGADSRRAEVDGAERAARLLDLAIARIRWPGTLDGGDVLEVDRTVYVGRGGRTNDAGIRQLAAFLGPAGARVVAVPVTRALHLKSALTALPDGTIVGWRPLVDDASIFPRFLATPEESGAHVVPLGDDRLLIADDCPRSAELYAGLGYEPVPVAIGEFQKLEGCVTCLSVRILGASRP